MLPDTPVFAVFLAAVLSIFGAIAGPFVHLGLAAPRIALPGNR